MLPLRLSEIAIDQKIIASVCLERYIKHIAQERNGPGDAFDGDVEHHPYYTDARYTKLQRPLNDVKRDQRINEIANAGNQSDNAGEPEAKSTGKDERVVEPSRHRLNIGDSSID